MAQRSTGAHEEANGGGALIVRRDVSFGRENTLRKELGRVEQLGTKSSGFSEAQITSQRWLIFIRALQFLQSQLGF